MREATQALPAAKSSSNKMGLAVNKVPSGAESSSRMMLSCLGGPKLCYFFQRQIYLWRYLLMLCLSTNAVSALLSPYPAYQTTSGGVWRSYGSRNTLHLIPQQITPAHASGLEVALVGWIEAISVCSMNTGGSDMSMNFSLAWIATRTALRTSIPLFGNALKRAEFC